MHSVLPGAFPTHESTQSDKPAIASGGAPYLYDPAQPHTCDMPVLHRLLSARGVFNMSLCGWPYSKRAAAADEAALWHRLDCVVAAIMRVGERRLNTVVCIAWYLRVINGLMHCINW